MKNGIMLMPWLEWAVAAAIHEAIRAKGAFELEHRIIRSDGSLGWAHSRAVPILDASNEIVEWFGVARDITRRKEAEEKLRQYLRADHHGD